MITIFTTPSCVYCGTLKKFLTQRNVQFETQPAEGEHYKNLANKYGFTVPLIHNDELDQGMVGFNIGKLLKLI